MTALAASRRRDERGAAPRPPASARGLAALAVLALASGLVLGRPLPREPSATPPADATTQGMTDPLTAARRAVDAAPGDPGGWQDLGIAAVREAAATGDPSLYELSQRALRRAEQLAPDDPRTALGRATLALARHDFSGALRDGQRALAANPTDTAALGAVVDAQVELGDYDAAQRTLQRLVGIRPDLPALARVSYLRELHGDLAGATQAMAQAVSAGAAAGADRAAVLTLLGDLELKGGDAEASRASYAQARQALPGYPAATVGQARVLAARGEVGRAAAVLDKLVARYPLPAAVTLLADLRTLQGDPGLARQATELAGAVQALQRGAGVGVDLETAVFEADHGDPADAVRLARRAWRARPDNVFAASTLAWALLRAGQPAAALPLARRSLRLDTADGLLHFHAASVLVRNGHLRDARHALRSAFAHDPWFSFAQQGPARALADRLGVAVPTAWPDP